MVGGPTPSGTRLDWEKAEIERSAVEAESLARQADRPLSAEQIQRYLSPPLTSDYPLEYAFALLGDLRGKDVLDYGAGDGTNTVVLRAKGARVVALDISPDLLAIAERRLRAHNLWSDVTLLTASGHEIPLPDSSTDWVFGSAILHHLDLDIAASEIHRVLRPGGRALFKEPVRDSRLAILYRRIFPNRDDEISPFEYPLTTAGLSAFRSRFATIAVRRFRLPATALCERLSVPETLVRFSRRFDAALLKMLPWASRWATIEVSCIEKPRE